MQRYHNGFVSPESEDLVRARQILRTGVGKAIREQLGLSLAEFGASMDPPVPAASIWRWETGATRPRADHAVNYMTTLRSMKGASTALDLVEVR